MSFIDIVFLEVLCNKTQQNNHVHMKKEFLPLIKGHKVGDKVFILNQSHSKL